MLQLRHMFFCGRFLRERPGQHELGLENRPGRFDPAVERCRHPAYRWMPDLPLDIRNDLTGIGLVPAPVQVLGNHAELDNEIAGQVFGFDFAALFPPEPEQGGLVVAHDNPSVRAANEIAAIGRLDRETYATLRAISLTAFWSASDARSEGNAPIRRPNPPGSFFAVS